MHYGTYRVEDHSDLPYTVDSSRFGTPQVWIGLDAFQRMLTYVRLCAQEINGFGLVTQHDDGVFVIDDVFITEQSVAAGHAEADQTDMHKVLYELIANGRDQDFERMRCQWHSHVGGVTRFSSVDTSTIDRIKADWWISLVLNHYGHVGCRLDMFEPFRLGINVPFHVMIPGPSVETVNRIGAEMDRKVHVEPLRGMEDEDDELDEEEPVYPPLFVSNVEAVMGSCLSLPVNQLVPVASMAG